MDFSLRADIRRYRAIGLAALLAVCFVIYYVSGEDGVYLWDFRGYWDRYKDLGNALAQFDLRVIARLIGGIIKFDYNVSPVILLQPFSLLFPGSRTAYIAAVVLIYLLPTAFLSAKVGLLVAEGPTVSETTFISLLGAALLYPLYWVPSLRGYPDIVGLVPLALATLLVLKNDFGRTVLFRSAVILGVLLWAPFLLRRWYAFSIISFAVCSYAYSIASNAARTQEPWRRIKIVTTNYALAGGVAALLAMFFQPLLILSILQTNYGDIYQYYQISGIEHFEKFVKFFGPIPLAGASFGALVGLKRQETRLATLFVICNAVLLYFLFTRVQALGPHHYLPLAFWIFCLNAIAICVLLHRLGTVVNVAGGLVLMVAFWGTFFPLPPLGKSLIWLAPETNAYQLKFPDKQNYSQLLADAKGLVAPGDKIAVFGGGNDDDDAIISDELFEVLEGERSKDWLVRTAHIDRRDRFMIEPLLARYAIVPDASHPTPLLGFPQNPKPEHLQQVVIVPAERIREQRGIGAAYRRLPMEYRISSGVTVHIYEKVRPFTPDEIAELIDTFYQLYPDWRRTYDFAQAVLAASVKPLGRGAKIEVELPDRLEIWPDGSAPVRLAIPAEALLRKAIVGFMISVDRKWLRCSGAQDIPIQVKTNSGLVWSGDASSQERMIPAPTDKSNAISFAIGPSREGCEHVVISPVFGNGRYGGRVVSEVGK